MVEGLRFVDSLSDEQVKDLERLFRDEWWTRGRSTHDVRTLLAGSDFVVGLVEDGSERLVAFARVLTDGIIKAFVFDVIVEPSARGKRLGRAIMEHVLEHPKLASVRHIELYCLPELAPFYRRFGFSEEVGGVWLMRRS